MLSVLGGVDRLSPACTAERAVGGDGSVQWVVVDAELAPHPEACSYLAGLRGTVERIRP
jgi:hypothetical protein